MISWTIICSPIYRDRDKGLRIASLIYDSIFLKIYLLFNAIIQISLVGSMIDGSLHFLVTLSDRVSVFGFMTSHLPLFSTIFQNEAEVSSLHHLQG